MAVARALCIAVIAVVATACGRPAATAPPNAAASASLPDWSGIWLPDIEDQFKQIDSNPLPWKPEVAAEVRRLTAAEAAGHPKGLFANCLPEAMPAWMLVPDGTHGGWCRGVTLLDSGKKLEC